MSRAIEIQPASLAAVQHSDRHGRVEVSDDVQSVARQLRDIDPALKLFFHPDGEFFCVERHVPKPDGSVDEQLVTTATELDARLVERVRQVGSASYDFVAELDRLDAAADKARDDRLSERIAPASEKLRWAMRKDLSLHTDRAFIGEKKKEP